MLRGFFGNCHGGWEEHGGFEVKEKRDKGKGFLATGATKGAANATEGMGGEREKGTKYEVQSATADKLNQVK